MFSGTVSSNLKILVGTLLNIKPLGDLVLRFIGEMEFILSSRIAGKGSLRAS
jgi:hypothetical protein